MEKDAAGRLTPALGAAVLANQGCGQPSAAPGSRGQLFSPKNFPSRSILEEICSLHLQMARCTLRKANTLVAAYAPLLAQFLHVSASEEPTHALEREKSLLFHNHQRSCLRSSIRRHTPHCSSRHPLLSSGNAATLGRKCRLHKTWDTPRRRVPVT